MSLCFLSYGVEEPGEALHRVNTKELDPVAGLLMLIR